MSEIGRMLRKDWWFILLLSGLGYWAYGIKSVINGAFLPTNTVCLLLVGSSILIGYYHWKMSVLEGRVKDQLYLQGELWALSSLFLAILPFLCIGGLMVSLIQPSTAEAGLEQASYATLVTYALTILDALMLALTAFYLSQGKYQVPENVIAEIAGEVFLPGMETPPNYRLLSAKLNDGWGLKLGENYGWLRQIQCADGEFRLQVLASAKLFTNSVTPHPPIKLTEQSVFKIPERGVDLIQEQAKSMTLGQLIRSGPFQKSYLINNIPFEITARAEVYNGTK